MICTTCRKRPESYCSLVDDGTTPSPDPAGEPHARARHGVARHTGLGRVPSLFAGVGGEKHI